MEGTVSNRVTGQPVRKAHITLKPAKGDGSIDATTDSHGRFALADVQPGTYILTAEHDGFAPQRYGAKRPGEEQPGERIELAAGAVRNGVDVRMTPLGSIMGVVRDEDGDPVRDVQVSAIEYRYGPEGRRLHVSTTTETDASGEFRIFDLPTGTYYLEAKRASVSKTRAVEAYATTYFSGASQFSAATPLVLAAGQDVRGADFVLRTDAVSSLRGRIVAPEGSKCSIGLRDAQRQATVKRNAYTIRVDLGADAALDKDLRFEYSELPVGNHWLSARCKVNEQTYSTRMAVFLDAAGLNNLEVRPLAPSTLTGHVRIDGESTSKITDTAVTLRQQSDDPFLLFGSASDGDEGDGKVGDDGTFSFHGVFPGVFHVALHPPAGLYVKSIALDGRDVTETGLDLRAGGMSMQVEAVLSANGGSIDGWVENGAGATVTLIPTSPHSPAEPMRMAVGADGHFVFPVVAPGRYQLFTWQDADPDEALYSAEFRKPYESKSQTVDVTEKQKTTVRLQPISTLEK